MTSRIGFFSGLIFLGACAHPPQPPIENLSGHEDLSSYTLTQVRGTRDGDRLDAEAKFGGASSEGSSSTLTVTMRFDVGAPTRLRSGQWQWARDGRIAGGAVAERSVMFLGGQSGPPSIGGRFDLLDSAGAGEYRITIPTTELQIRFPAGATGIAH